jgi:glycosyltransferase involved in cell wall biosynthesis
MLSICIPTKNRRTYFYRCIQSLKTIANERSIEILILDQSGYASIFVQDWINTRVLQMKDELCLNEVYRILLEESRYDWIWFLEDDDQLLRLQLPSFFDHLKNFSHVVHITRHIESNWLFSFQISSKMPCRKCHFIKVNKNKLSYFQLSHIIFRKDWLDLSFMEHINSIYNDFILFIKLTNDLVIMNPYLIWMRGVHEQQISYESRYETYVYEAFIKKLCDSYGSSR